MEPSTWFADTVPARWLTNTVALETREIRSMVVVAPAAATLHTFLVVADDFPSRFLEIDLSRTRAAAINFTGDGPSNSGKEMGYYFERNTARQLDSKRNAHLSNPPIHAHHTSFHFATTSRILPILGKVDQMSGGRKS